MARVMPILFKLQQPFEAKGFAPLFPNVRPRSASVRLWTDLISRSATFGTSATGFGNCLNGGYGEGTATDGSDVIPISTTQTIECRFLLPSTPGGTVVLWGINGGSGGLYLGVTSGGVLTVSTGTTSYNGVTVVSDNAWHHVRLVLNGTSGSLLYLDGNSENSLGTALSISPSSTFQLGAFIGSFQWPGSIDEFAVWNSPLVGTFTPPTAPYTGAEPGLVSLYHVDGDVKAALISSGPNAYSMVADSGSFALSGQAMTPAVALPAATGSFALTGNALTPAVTMTAARGTFVLTGNPMTPAVTLPAATGAFSLTGNAATLTHGYSLIAARGSFTLTGNAVALEVGHVFTAATGAFVLTGRAMTLAVALSAATGAFSLTGYSATLAVAMPAATGVFALTGIAASLKVTMSAATGLFALTGNAAGLNKVGSSTLTAATGTFALTGYAAALAVRLSATTGVLALTGSNAAFPLARRLTGLTGAFSLSGNAAGLAVRFPALAAQFVLSGFAAGGAVARRLIADPGSFVITGYDLAFVDFSPSAKTYPLAGIAQAYPGTAATYPITVAQPYPQSSAQTYPLEGIPQQYPLAS